MAVWSAGTVAEAGFDPALGNYLVLDHGGGLTTTYGQLARNDFVAVDGQVEAGEQIGTVGKTGQATGYHLHFEVAENGTQVDPLDHLMPGRLADRTRESGSRKRNQTGEARRNRRASSYS